jgi:hypothetical protein
VRFSSRGREEVCLGGVWRYRVGSPEWKSLSAEEAEEIIGLPHKCGRVANNIAGVEHL